MKKLPKSLPSNQEKTAQLKDPPVVKDCAAVPPLNSLKIKKKELKLPPSPFAMPVIQLTTSMKPKPSLHTPSHVTRPPEPPRLLPQLPLSSPSLISNEKSEMK